jgi:hypothetical protein
LETGGVTQTIMFEDVVEVLSDIADIDGEEELRNLRTVSEYIQFFS